MKKNTPSDVAKIICCTGLFVLFSLQANGQIIKNPSAAKMLSSEKISELLKKLTPKNSLFRTKPAAPAVTPNTPTLSPQPDWWIYYNIPGVVYPAAPKIYSVVNENDTPAQEKLHKFLAKPAPDFYNFFKQISYAHQNSRSVAKKMDRNYFYEVNRLLQHAAFMTQTQGYEALAEYLKSHKGVMPTFAENGSFQTSKQARQMLTFYASEELGALLDKMLARPQGKQDPTPEEWLNINVLSTMLPNKTRPIFYDLLLEKKYDQLQIVALDPYLKRHAAQTIANGNTQNAHFRTPSRERRIAFREEELGNLKIQQQQIEKSLEYLHFCYTSSQTTFDLMNAFKHKNNSPEAIRQRQAEMEQKHREYLKAEIQLKEVSSQIQQLNAELDFLRTQK